MGRWLIVALGVSTILRPVAATPDDPARNLSRVRLIVSTRAASADVTVLDATVASHHSTVLRGAPAVRSSQIDRANGRVSDDQWEAVVSTAADWVVVTSWNEWWENTQIEPSERYGRVFLDRTRDWIRRFKTGPGAR